MEEVHPRPEAGLPDIKRTSLRGPGPPVPRLQDLLLYLANLCGSKVVRGSNRH